MRMFGVWVARHDERFRTVELQWVSPHAQVRRNGFEVVSLTEIGTLGLAEIRAQSTKRLQDPPN